MVVPEQSETAVTSGRATSGWGRVTWIVVLLSGALSLLMITFAWPSSRAEMSGQTIAVTGEADLVDQFMSSAGGNLDGIADLERVDDRDAAVRGVRERNFIGAVVLVNGAPEVLTASANGQVPAAVMTEVSSRVQTMLDTQIYAGIRTGIASAAGRGVDPAAVAGQMPEVLPQVTVTDLVPYSEDDASGAGATAAGIPLTVGALLAGLTIAYLVKGVWRKAAAVLGLEVGGGLLLTLILDTWLTVYPGSFGILWLALGLSLMATSGLFAGLHSAFGGVGIGIAAGITLFAAMPWAAFAIPYKFLPAGLGYIGQCLIPGSTTTLVRVLSYFPDASTAGQWCVLCAWVLVGATLLIFGRRSSVRAREDV
ncbi:MAG: hypothetical protein ACFN04_06780 [Propionibacterium acidifaciens]